MQRSPNIKKLVQITEEAAPPLHVPIVFGNECFIVTQQDVRKLEETRHYSYSKLASGGQLIPMEQLGHDGNTCEAILNACKYRMQCEQSAAATDSNMLLEFLRSMSNNSNHYKTPQCMETGECGTMPLQEVAPTATVATVQQQLQWAKSQNSSAPFPVTYCAETATADIFPTTCEAPTLQQQQQHNAGNICSSPTTCTRGNNTMEVDTTANATTSAARSLSAREQLKKKKMDFFCT